MSDTTMSAPSPLNVAFVKQVNKAQAESERYARLRASGYKGPVTRNDLAAQALRNSR